MADVQVPADGVGELHEPAVLFGDAVLAVGADERQARVIVSRMQQALERAGLAGSFGHAPYSAVAGFPGALAAADAAMYQMERQRRSNRS